MAPALPCFLILILVVYVASNVKEKVILGTCDSVFGVQEQGTRLIFQSPEFPQRSQGDLICSYQFELVEDVGAVLLSFVTLESDGPKLGLANNECDQDILYIKGLGQWSPPGKCGNLTGYSMSIYARELKSKKNITLLAVMTSESYRWSIKINQLSHSKCSKPSHQGSPKGANNVYTRDAYGDVRGRPKRSLEEPRLVEFVVSGDPTAQGQIPWQASMRIDVDATPALRQAFPVRSTGPDGRPCDRAEGLHLCGGSIIGDREILLAAHCFTQRTKLWNYFPLHALRIHLGAVNLCHYEDGEAKKRVQVFGVETVMLHFAYEPKLFMNDVAIVRLNRSIQFNEHVKKIKLAGQGDTFYEHDAIMSGWGRTNLSYKGSGSSELKHSGNLCIDTPQNCQKYLHVMTGLPPEVLRKYREYQDYFDSLLCTRTKNISRDVLFGEGDSGGPLVSFAKDSKEPILVGIISFYLPYMRFVLNSAGSYIDFYQSVAYFRLCIDLTMCFFNSPLSTLECGDGQ